MSSDNFWSATHALRKRYNRYWFWDHATRTALRRDNRWTDKRLSCYDELVQVALDSGARRGPIDVHDKLSFDDFHKDYLNTDTPVVFRGAGLEWPSSQWTSQWLGDRYSKTTVRLINAAPSEPRGKPGEGRDVNYKEIADSMDSGGDLYARFSNIMEQHPELIDDVDLEWFRGMRRDMNKVENWGFFMGGAGTATGLHSSIAPNLFYQISGEKRWYIYPAQAAPLFSPAVKCSPYFYSEVDVSRPDEWPIAEATPGWIANLVPGDVLYVPSFAWHQVYNDSATMASGYRWISARDGWRNSKVQTILAATCSNPSVWTAAKHRDLPTLLDEIDY